MPLPLPMRHLPLPVLPAPLLWTWEASLPSAPSKAVETVKEAAAAPAPAVEEDDDVMDYFRKLAEE